ncbi:hypothetical protein [Leeuwenhoekiella sp. H156]|uniref:hypothetical protein n=1 Tax=Leeuwenhoekiella sp. H156 TaxID=3450128 RepID=UPI003FA431D6
MTKNKIKTYALSIVVIAIWSVIGYQIYSALNPSDNPFIVPKAPTEFKSELGNQKETFNILNNYRDPFLGKLPEKKDKPEAKLTSMPVVRDTIIFPVIEYRGTVQSAEAKQTVFSVSVNGTEAILSAGESIQEVTLVRGNASEISISFKGKRKVIKK